MKSLLSAFFIIIASLSFASEHETRPTFSYLIRDKGVCVPCLGLEWERDREKVEVYAGYSRVWTKPTYHHYLISFNTAYSFIKSDKDDMYAKGGFTLSNTYSKVDPAYKSTRMAISPFVGVGMKITDHHSVELIYFPISMFKGKVNQDHSTNLRLIFRL